MQLKREWSKFGFFCVAVLWGASFAFQQPAVHAIGAISFTFWNFFLSAIVFLVYAGVKKANLLYRIREGIILGIFLAGIEIFQMLGLELSTAADTAFLSNFGMLIVPYLGWMLLKHKVGLENNLALVLAAIGMYFLTGGLSGFGVGEGALLLSALSMAFYFLYLERYSGERGSHTITLCAQQFLVVSVLCLVCGFFFSVDYGVPAEQQFSLLWLTLVFTTFTYLLIHWAGKYADEMVAALYDGVVEPLVGGIVAWVVFLEPTTSLKVFGGILMVCAFGFAGIFSKRHFLIRELHKLNTYIR